MALRATRFGWLAVLLASGCASYVPRPIDLPARRAALEAAALDDAVGRDALHACGLPLETAWTKAAFTCVLLARSPRLAEARATLDQAIAATTTAKARGAATLSLSTDRNIQHQAGSADWLWGLIVDLPLDMAHRRAVKLAIADAGVRSALLDFSEAAWSLRRDAQSGIRTLLLAKQQQALAERSLAAAREWKNVVERRIAAGEAPASERGGPGAALAKAQADTATANQRVQTGADQAALATGIPSARLSAVGWSKEWTDEMTLPTSDVAAWREDALLHRADLLTALSAYSTRELELQQQIHLQYPQISIGPGYTFDHGVRKVNFNLSLLLPTWDRNAGPIAEAEAKRAAAAAHVDAVQALALNEIDAAIASVARVQAAFAAVREQAQRAQQLLDHLAAAQRLGEEDAAARKAAEVDLLNAPAAIASSLESALAAQAALEDALRRPLDDTERTLLISMQPKP